MNRVTTPTFGSALISRTHRIENASECETCTIDTFVAGDYFGSVEGSDRADSRRAVEGRGRPR